jgi:hypothetical protein
MLVVLEDVVLCSMGNLGFRRGVHAGASVVRRDNECGCFVEARVEKMCEV